MSEISEATKQLVAALKTERDDLKVRMHLASMEVKEQVQAEWEAVEHKWAKVKASTKEFNRKVGQTSAQVKEELEDASESIGEVAENVAKDIRESYARIRDKLSSNNKS